MLKNIVRFKFILGLSFGVFLCLCFVLLFLARDVRTAPINELEALDAVKDGPIYGDREGLLRIMKLEKQLHEMRIRKDHPRIFLNSDELAKYRERVRKGHPAFRIVIDYADKGDAVNLAFAYLMLDKDKPDVATRCAKDVIQILLNTNPSRDRKDFEQTLAKMTLAFDWVYQAMTEEERQLVIEKLSTLAQIPENAKKVREGSRQPGETFHRGWGEKSWQAWPELALAHHIPDAEFLYKARWRHDWIWGDGARLYAYLADGTPYDGYSYGAEAVGWFLTLKSATGINLVDSEDFPWCQEAAYHQLYRMDFGRKRLVFHHGAALGAAGCDPWDNGAAAWIVRSYITRSFGLITTDPYAKWVLNRYFNGDISSWILSDEYFAFFPALDGIVQILFDDREYKKRNLFEATWEEFPATRYFPGGNEVYMRSGWSEDSTMAGFRVSPAFARSSHCDFDANTFVLYRKGVLSPDSGVYDVYEGQTNYWNYQKMTISHNNIMIMDPKNPDGPIKFPAHGYRVDPGGVEFVHTRTFGTLWQFGTQDVFLHNPEANLGDIIAFESHPDFDYTVGEAAKAYGKRLKEYKRSVVFIRKDTKAYFVVFDRVETTSPSYVKKWLLHLVTEPKINGDKVSDEIPGHIDTYNGDLLRSENAFGTAALYCKTLLPTEHLIRRIGGAGYEFYVEGTKPKNWPITQECIDRIESQMGGPWQEVGTWRIELMPKEQRTRDYFLNVMYLCDVNDSMLEAVSIETASGDMVGSFIDNSGDIKFPGWVILFSEKEKNITSDTYSVLLSNSTKHLLCNLMPGKDYKIYLDSELLETKQTGNQGTLYFKTDTNDGKYHTIKFEQ